MAFKNGWNSLKLTPEEANGIVSLAVSVAQSIDDPVILNSGIQSSIEQSEYFGWGALEHSHIATLFGVLDQTIPGKGFYRSAHNHLSKSLKDNPLLVSASVFGGLTQVGMAAVYLNSYSGRYGKLLERIDAEVNRVAAESAARLSMLKEIGVASSDYDFISGLSGVCAYLLARHTAGVSQSALVKVIETLIHLSWTKMGVTGLQTPQVKIVGSLKSADSYEYGLINCGISHGLPGVLAVLSKAVIADVLVSNLKEAVAGLTHWLMDIAIEDEHGYGWPQAVKLDEACQCIKPTGLSLDAWCYGGAGVSRALFLAGLALDDSSVTDYAKSAVQATLIRNRISRSLSSPTICHGLSGLLLTSLRFGQNYQQFECESAELLRLILDTHDKNSTFGFRDVEGCSTQVDNPGFLTGSCGVAMCLLAASTDIEPSWDRILLLS